MIFKDNRCLLNNNSTTNGTSIQQFHFFLIHSYLNGSLVPQKIRFQGVNHKWMYGKTNIGLRENWGSLLCIGAVSWVSGTTQWELKKIGWDGINMLVYTKIKEDVSHSHMCYNWWPFELPHLEWQSNLSTKF